jgi:hypothetical protein
VNVRAFGIGGGESFDEKKATEARREAIKKLVARIAEVPIGSTGQPGTSRTVDLEKILIADIDGNIATLNKGKNAGYRIGQELGVYRQDRVIKDPATGKVINITYQKLDVIKLAKIDAGFRRG